MKKYWLLISLTLSCLSYAQVSPDAVAQAVNQSIDITAGLEQWEGLPRYPVILSNSALDPQPVSSPGYYSVAWDDANLYLLGVFEQPEDTVLANFAADVDQWWTEDTIELFFKLTPDAEQIQFAVNPAGTQFELYLAGTDYNVATTVEEDRWIVQLAFPAG